MCVRDCAFSRALHQVAILERKEVRSGIDALRDRREPFTKDAAKFVAQKMGLASTANQFR